MPSFDAVSEVNMHEVTNAVDQANREAGTRFDLKDSGSTAELKGEEILCKSATEFNLKQFLQILEGKLAKRGVDIRSLEWGTMEVSGKEARQTAKVKQGLDTPLAKDIVKAIKASGAKVQAAIQDGKVRVTGKKKDDLQETIALLKKENFSLPLQFVNFRD
ncbi:MAG: YajQ family cyclic di-GMP-binding protein [Deltaproteobacteria bacterium]|nr:YajQ family cyclic di-GMP-binding protein [Deltaproteobacteria bacterium]